METLEVRGVSVSFDGRKVLEDVSVTLRKGELVCLLGVSGGGKTTLFNVISGLLKPDAGQVLLDGEDITGNPAISAICCKRICCCRTGPLRIMWRYPCCCGG